MSLADKIRAEGDTAARPGQMEALHDLAWKVGDLEGEVARLRHLPRALEMANDRAERWRQRYNDAMEKLPQAWDEGWHTGQLWAFSDLDEHAKDTNPYRGDA